LVKCQNVSHRLFDVSLRGAEQQAEWHGGRLQINIVLTVSPTTFKSTFSSVSRIPNLLLIALTDNTG
jgi:hypothetical protein